ncbi:Fe2OG dioxygenase domain-containing protein [Haematococcus lacustris]|uniref:Fe2OG dioxygenase domain-containing protein n=1 Tax=Haematococcus lacustris TaxID=44745 RepID=A0A699YML7_HAELA|nr:Fe2OG dioxygenase domain-containing protein [Haematococcus lacustris]
MDDGAVVSCSRNIALIVYLTRDWQPEYGGLLLDLEAPGGTRTYVPEFNSAIAFRIPRWHAVTPMTTDRPRYSLFGWWLEPGHKYDLQLRPAPSHAPAAAATSPGQAVTQEGEHT